VAVLADKAQVTLDGPEKLSTAYKPATGPSRAVRVLAASKTFVSCQF
jgi:hypothetical protein